MLNRRHRFHGYGSLKAVYQRGHTVRGPGLNLKYIINGSTKPYRVAVVVSRKVSKSAVTRNRIRRRVYETVRQMDDGIQPGSDLVFTIFSQQISELSALELQKIINELLAKTIRS